MGRDRGVPPARFRRLVAAVAVVAGALASVLIGQPARALTFTVTNVNDSGPGSLRQAILDANAAPGADTIPFTIATLITSTTAAPGSQTFVINLLSPLPAITGPVLIDGTTQPGFVAGGPPAVVVRGQSTFDGLVVMPAGSPTTIRSLALVGFADAIQLDGATGSSVAGNLIGILPSGAASPNQNGVLLTAGANGITVTGNTISGNTANGVRVEGSTGNRLTLNRIGTDRAGAAAVPNGAAGVLLTGGSTGNAVGEPGAGNLISGNAGPGVQMDEASPGPATANTVAANTIGTNLAGTAAIGNQVGIFAGQSVDVITGNQISGNPGGGLHADLFGLSGFVVRGNRIGTDAAGTGVVANGLNGVSLSGGSGHLVGGTVAGEGNVVSGNARAIDVDNAAGVVIQGNLVGTDATGTVALGNANGGIQVADGPGYVVGGAGAAGNVISGNTGFGLLVTCTVGSPQPTSADVVGNRIGTDVAGTAAMANSTDGLLVAGCAGAVDVSGNLISGNLGRGAVVDATGSSILGNLVGTVASGAPLGNGSHGIEVGGSNIDVGAAGPGGPNTIAFNGGAGVLVTAGTGNDIAANSIHDNAGLGIDLGPGAGPTPNDTGDVDEGPNRLQNFPVLTSAFSGPSVTVNGTLQSLPATTFAVDLYDSPTCDPSGFGEGRTFLTTATVATDGAGNAAFTVSLAAGQTAITATALDPLGNTSEFSACLAVTAPPGITIGDVTASEGAGAAVVTVSLPSPALSDVTVTLTTGNGTATAPADYAATSQTIVIPSGQQSATVSVPIVADGVAEADETFTVTLSNPVGAVLGVAQRTVTIVDDDFPSMSLSDATVVEGNGGTTSLVFTVTLSPAATRPVSVVASTTGGGTATPGTDFVPVTATLVLPPGTRTAAFAVTVLGDVVAEPDEVVFVALSSPTNATVADAGGVGVIVSDDAGPTPTTTTTTTTTTVPPSTTSTTRPQTRIILIETPTTAPQTRIISVTPAPPPAVPPVVVVPTTAPQPPTVTSTSVAPTTVPPTTVPPTTVPPTTTSVPPTTTTVALTTSTTTTPAVTTTVPPSTVPTTVAPAGPPPAATLVASAPDGTAGGPPGVGLDVSGSGYAGCGTVYFFFDGVRVGSGRPNGTGAVTVGGLSVPGDAPTGARRVTSSCRASGAPLRAEAPFTVAEADVHRLAFLTALPQPRHVNTEAAALATSALVAVILLILLAFPSQLFNATFSENYDEIRGWFRLPRRVLDSVGKVRQSVAFSVFALLGGLTYSLLSPDFGPNRASLALMAGMTLAVVVVTGGFCVPNAIYMRRTYGEWGKLAVLPGSLLVGALCVTLSRLFDFQPGYLYGVLAGVAFGRALAQREQGRLSALTASFVLAVSVGAWALRVPVSAAAAEPDAGVWLVASEACLGAIFLLGLESVVVGLLPMRFLDGARLLSWSKAAWAMLFTTGLFALIHVLLSPGSGYVGHTSGGVTIAVIVLYVAFGAASVAFWAYFRFRPERWIPRPARGDQSALSSGG